MPEIVPSQVHPDGLRALGEILQGARTVSAAVAFVTESGVERLGQLFKGANSPEAEIVARAGGVTLDRLESSLNQREIRPSRQKDRELLIADLMELYEVTVADQLTTKQGRHYVPTRFLQGIRRAEAGGDPVQLVYRICRHQTEGFDVILDADRPDLTVESLVIDTSKPYHDLFTESTRQLSAERLKQFPSWSSDSQSGSGRSGAL